MRAASSPALKWFSAALAAGLLFLAPAAARAHAVLLETVPADGRTLDAAPERFTLRFNEPVRVASLRLVQGDGRSLTLAPEADTAPEQVTARLPELEPGSYIASWRLVSADGHPVAGSSVFTIGTTGPGAAPAAGTRGIAARGIAAREAADVPPGLWLGYGIARFAVYAASLTAAGAALFLVLFDRPARAAAVPVRPFALGMALIGILATLTGLGLETAILRGNGMADAAVALVSGSGLSPGAEMAPGFRLLGLILIFVGMLWSSLIPVAGPFAGTSGALLVAASFALTGHTAPQASTWLSGFLVLHLLAAAFWIGSFWPLIRATRCPDVGAVRRLVREFSLAAAILVPALVAAGLGLAVVLVGDPAALVATAYGRTLAIKVLLVGGMLALAALNKWRLTPRLGNEPGATGRLRRSIGIEAGLAALVLAATVALTSVHPPAHDMPQSWLLQALHSGRTVSRSVGSLDVALTVTPALPGTNTFDVEVTSPDGIPRDVPEAALVLSRPDLGIEALSRPMERVGSGLFHYAGPEIAIPGPWNVDVEILVSDFEKQRVDFDVAIGSAHEHRAR
ncbi:MAG TPA: copper resistance protein CopC [Arenibaculum sp.]|nr:copper resistance protein CopC [Arenibaculum sp.]